MIYALMMATYDVSIDNFFSHRQNDIVPIIYSKGPIGREDSSTENVVIEFDKDPDIEGYVRMRIRVIDAGWELYINIDPEKILDVLKSVRTILDLLEEVEDEKYESIATFYELFDCGIWSKDYLDDMIDVFHTTPNCLKCWAYTSQPTRMELYNFLYQRMERDLASISATLQSALARLKRRLYASMMSAINTCQAKQLNGVSCSRRAVW